MRRVAVWTFMTALTLACVATNAYAQLGSAWEGAWGEFTQTSSASGISWLGHGILISACKADKCEFSVTVEGKAGHGRAGGYVDIDSSTTAIAHLISSNEEHCSLMLQLVSGNDAIDAKRNTGDCNYFLTPGASFEHQYPLHSRAHYVGQDVGECFGSSGAAEHAICTSEVLNDELQKWQLLYLRVAELHGQPDELAAERSAQRQIVGNCDHVVNVAGCVHDGFAESTENLDARQTAWLSSVTEAGAPAEADAEASEMKGSYRHSFPNSDVDGDHFTSTDRLDIAPLPNHTIRFSANLEFYNGHECSIEGVAKFARAGFFVFQDKDNSAGPLGCVLEIIPDKGGVRLADPTGGCKMITCGERGGYNGAAFTTQDRR